MAARVAGQPSQGAPAGKSAAAAPRSLTGCMDEQFGQYVLLDSHMVKIAGLQYAGTSNDIFAKFVGHEVQIKGTKSPGSKATFTVTGVVQIADICGGQSK